MPDKTTTEAPEFGFILRRPFTGDQPGADETTVYLAPDFATPVPWWRSNAGDDPRSGEASTDWSLSLPHHCGEWPIGDGSLDQVLDAALRMRAELDQAIDVLRAEPHT
jgi:hypothetical protein